MDARSFAYVAVGALVVFLTFQSTDGDDRPLAFGEPPLITITTTSPSPVATAGPDVAVLDPVFIEVDAAPDVTNERILVLTGRASEGARIFTPTRESQVLADGTFAVEALLEPGPNEIAVEALGLDGEIAVETIDVRYEPGAIGDVPFAAFQTIFGSEEEAPFEFFSGTAPPFSDIVISSPVGEAAAIADADGDWSGAVFLTPDGTGSPIPITVTAQNGTAQFEFVPSPGG